MKTAMRTPKQRTCRLTQTADGNFALVIRQKQGNITTVDAYFLKSIPCEMNGRAFQLTKHDGVKYNVRLNGAESTCDCKGHTRFGHCKHCESLLVLEATGKL